MSDFNILKSAVEKKLNEMYQNATLFVANVDRDVITETYLNAWPAGTNEIFRERATHDCSCCKNFIRRVGGVISFDENSTVVDTVWDVNVPEPYQTVANAMAEYVRSVGVRGVFLTSERTAGSLSNRDDKNPDIMWDHFHTAVPSKFVNTSTLGHVLGGYMSNRTVLENSFREISEESCDLVIDLIDDGSLYRGEAGTRRAVDAFRSALRDYNKVEGDRNLYLWAKSVELGDALCRFKNTLIGTLLCDITEGYELEDAVKSYESKAAPENYKRPKALATPAMIESAKKRLTELGLLPSLPRRHANKTDITANNVLFVDRDVKLGDEVDDVFASITKKAKGSVPKLDRVEEVSYDKFLTDIVPSAESIEVMPYARHEGNLMTLVAPVNPEAPNMLQWENNFGWSYNGEVADSIDQRVSKAGGVTDAFMRFSLVWEGDDDLDLSVKPPKGYPEIYYGHKNSAGGTLDVDANAFGISKEPVENIFWKTEPPKGVYEVVVKNFRRRSGNNGFILKFKLGDSEQTMHFGTAVTDGQKVKAIKFKYLGNGKISNLETVVDLSGSDLIKKEVWGITTGTFVPVEMVMYSPNYWDEQEGVGNKHVFFILKDCVNPSPVRGFYNEFLKPELNGDRKVFEMLASEMKVPYNEDQMSGLGFATTKNAELVVKVKGSFERVLKVKF